MKGRHGGPRPGAGRPKAPPKKHWKDLEIARDYIAVREFEAELGWLMRELGWLAVEPKPHSPSAIRAVAAKHEVTPRHVKTCIDKYGRDIRAANAALLAERPNPKRPKKRNAAYYRELIRTAIGHDLPAYCDLPEPIPERLLELLDRLDWAQRKIRRRGHKRTVAGWKSEKS